MQFKSMVNELLEEMDAIVPNEDNIFMKEKSKIDFETKIWHLSRKIEAAVYHYDNVIAISGAIAEEIKKRRNSNPEIENIALGVKTFSMHFKVNIKDERIYFEVDAFFSASRAALDFLASVLSRYIKGTDFNRIRKIHEWLQDRNSDVALLINDAWKHWVEDLIGYRDHLMHRGVLFVSGTLCEKVHYSKSPNKKLQSYIGQMPLKESTIIICPLPINPNTSERLTRQDIFSLNDEEKFYGVSRSESSIAIKEDKEEIRRTVINYYLLPGFKEAKDLCRDYCDNLLDFSCKAFQLLRKMKFTHIKQERK